jgi:hypothetical protein
MLPLLPALILFLLQGPSNFERLAVDGRLPAALDAIHRQMDRPGIEQLSERDQETLASLLAAGLDTQFSNAFFAYLNRGNEHPHTPILASKELGRPILASRGVPPTQEGFERFQRSRDGPAISGSAC